MIALRKLIPVVVLVSVAFTIGESTGAVASVAACLPPPPGLVGWWPGDGNADDIVNGNDGVLGSGTGFAAGVVGQAFSFDGTVGHVSIPDGTQGVSLDGFSQLTIDAWIMPESLGWSNPDSGGFTAAIVSKYDSTKPDGISYHLTLQDGKLSLIILQSTHPDSKIGAVSANGIPIGTWSHVAGVWRGGSQVELYINGMETPASVIAEGPTPTVAADNNVPVNIGRIESFSGTYVGPAGLFDGLIDEVEIFDRALSADEVQSIYDAGDGGKCKDLHVADLNIEGAQVRFGAHSGGNDRFILEGTFVLGSDSGGVNLPDEQLEVSVGTASIVVPAGSLAVEDGQAVFEGLIDGTSVFIRIEMLEPKAARFRIRASNIDLTGTSNPVDIVLRIGDDSGFATLRLAGRLRFGV